VQLPTRIIHRNNTAGKTYYYAEISFWCRRLFVIKSNTVSVINGQLSIPRLQVKQFVLAELQMKWKLLIQMDQGTKLLINGLKEYK
jgi:hypothetical protein